MNFSHCAECLPELPESFSEIFSGIGEMPQRERECVFRSVHPYLERHQELSQKLLLHPRLLQQLCKKQQTLCHAACSSQSANRKTRVLFSDGCHLRKTKFTFPWQEWVYFLIFNFLVGPSLLHSYSRSTQPNRKPTQKKNPLTRRPT